MNSIQFAGIVLVIVTIVVVYLIRTDKQDRKNSDRQKWQYRAIDCSVYNGTCWIDKQLTFSIDVLDEHDTHNRAQEVVEGYMEAMHYPKGEYTIRYITRLTEDEYQEIRKDLFVTLHGYGYD